MKILNLITITLQILLFSQASSAITCESLLQDSSTQNLERLAVEVEPAEQPGTYSRGKLLNTSSIIGLQGGAFELLPNGGMITAKNGAFVCTNCGTVKKITRVPKNPELECVGCGNPMIMQQHQIPPLFVIKNNNQIYAWEHSIVRDKAIVEYFEKDAIGCGSCGTIKLEADKSCTNCGSSEIGPVISPPVVEVDFNELKRNPSKYYPELIKMGILDLAVVRSQGLMTPLELYNIARELMRKGELELYQVINRGFINPSEAVHEGWITLKQKRRAVTRLIEDNFVDTATAIENGWIAKEFAISQQLISRVDAANLIEPVSLAPKSLRDQARHRRHDMGEEDARITQPLEEFFGLQIPRARLDPNGPLNWRNLSGAYKRAIKIGVGTLAAAAVTGALLFTPHSVHTGPIAQGKISHISESLIVYDSQAVKDQYQDIRFDIDSPPAGVRVVTNGIESQIKSIETNSPTLAEPIEAIGQIMSVMVVEINGVEMKIYREGPAVTSFPGYQEGDSVPIVAEGMFNYRIGE